MDPVGDELDVRRVVEQRGHGHAGRPMVHAAHRVEEVRRGGRAGGVARPRLLDGRRGMADRDGRPASLQPADELERPGQLGRDGHEPEPIDERLERPDRHIGWDPQERRIVGAMTGRREERSLEVEPEWLGAIRRGRRHPAADPFGERAERRRAAPSRRSAGTRSPLAAAGSWPCRRGRPGRPSRRGRPSRGHARRRTPGRDTDRRHRTTRRSRRRRSARPRWRSARPRPDPRGRASR